MIRCYAWVLVTEDVFRPCCFVQNFLAFFVRCVNVSVCNLQTMVVSNVSGYCSAANALCFGQNRMPKFVNPSFDIAFFLDRGNHRIDFASVHWSACSCCKQRGIRLYILSEIQIFLDVGRNKTCDFDSLFFTSFTNASYISFFFLYLKFLDFQAGNFACPHSTT